jgi:hypothetical protein
MIADSFIYGSYGIRGCHGQIVGEAVSKELFDVMENCKSFSDLKSGGFWGFLKSPEEAGKRLSSGAFPPEAGGKPQTSSL